MNTHKWNIEAYGVWRQLFSMWIGRECERMKRKLIHYTSQSPAIHKIALKLAE
jgi:hypothetical protein